MTELVDRISAALVGLKMPRALEALGPTLRRLEQGEITAVEAIDALLSEEYALRETRRIDIALRTAKLLPVKTVESFDFAFQPSLDRERIAALAQLDFIRRRETVHFLGPPGTGKSHLATALGVAAVKAGKSVYKTTLAELTDTLAKAERQGRLAEKIRFFTRAALLVVDEIGYLPISKGGGKPVLPNRKCKIRKRRDDPYIEQKLRGMGRHLRRPRRRDGPPRPAPPPRRRRPNRRRKLQTQKTRGPHSRTRPSEYAHHAAARAEKTRPAQKGDPNRRLIWLAAKTPKKWGILLRHFWGILLRH